MADNSVSTRAAGARAIGSLPALRPVAISCRRCGRSNALPAALLIASARLDPTTTLGELPDQLRCTICNSRRITVRV